MEASPANARCVIWRPAGTPSVAALRTALEYGGATAIECDHPWHALAQLCAPTGLGPRLLVLVEPARLSGLDELIEAAARYAPQAKVWTFDPSCSPALQPWSRANATGAPPGASTPQPTPAPRTDAPARMGSLTGPTIAAIAGPGATARSIRLPPAPSLRLAGEGLLPPLPDDAVPSPSPDVKLTGAASPSAASATSGPTGTGSLLSPEELDMLLSPDGPT